MKTCETCKHWQEWNQSTRGSRAFSQGIGECEMVVMWWDASEWSNDFTEVERVIKPKYQDQKAFVQDASDCHASLYTRKDFGCVSHEDKS